MKRTMSCRWRRRGNIMSYVNSIHVTDRANYQNIKDWNAYFQDFKNKFIAQYPQGDFSQVSLILENRIFPNDVHLTGDIECSIEFIHCYFQGEVVFYDVNVKKSIMSRQCFCDKELRIMKTSTFEAEFNIANFSAKSQVYVEGGNFQTCRWNFIDNGIVKINGGNYKSLNVGYWDGGCILKELSFHFPEITGLVKVTGDKAYIEHLSLFQFSSDLALAIEDITVNSISIYRFRNEKAFRIFNLKSKKADKPTEFAIAESYLGKAEFYSIDFTSFDNVYFTDVHFTECSFVNIKWKYKIDSFKGRGIGKSKKEEQLPNKIAKLRNELNENYNDIENLKNDPDILEYYSKNREVFRQLKFANEKQGDIINGQKFHSREMLAYNRTLDFEKNIWTKSIIKLSYWFSDFGQSFTRPLLALFIGHWFLLIVLILSGYLDVLTINLSHPNEAGFKMGFEQYFRLINPLRRADFTFTGYQIVIDLAMRIWSSYMIYNVIRATRRFIK